MHKEEIQNLLFNFGFAEAMNKTRSGNNSIHMIHRCDRLKRLVEYHVDNLGLIKFIWAFDYIAGLDMIENVDDFEIWLNKE